MKLLPLMDKVLAGQTIYTKKGQWYISLKDGRLVASSWPNENSKVYISEFHCANFGIEHDDWEVYTQLYVKDLKCGDKFRFKGFDGTKFRVIKMTHNSTLYLLSEGTDELHTIEHNFYSEVELLT